MRRNSSSRSSWPFLVVKDIEGKVKGETIKENKIKVEEKGILLDKGNVL